MSQAYRVAIIGTGRKGGLIDDQVAPGSFHKPYGHFSAYKTIEQTEVVAVANRGAERLQRFADRFGVTNSYLDYREMIEKERPDIVSVTTRSAGRAEPVIFAAEHGVRAIFAEKGLSASLDEADRIAAAVKKHRVAFNWGPFRRYHDGYRKLREAIVRGDIGVPQHATYYARSDLTRHHSHTFDTAEMLLGDPKPEWVEGEFLDPDDPRAGNPATPLPRYDRAAHRYDPPPGAEIGDPLPGFFRVGYAGGVEASFIPLAGRFDVDVFGTEGWVSAWDWDQEFRIRRFTRRKPEAHETIVRPVGESPTICAIRELIRELKTGERTSGNIDVAMQSVEAQFGLAQSHLSGRARVSLPIADRSLYITGG